MDERLKELYYSADDTGSCGGVERFYWSAVEDQVPNITRNIVRDILFRQRVYTIHKHAIRHFYLNRIYVCSIDKQWQGDLAVMVGLQSDNNGNWYILTVIDVFIKYACSVPVKHKDGKFMLEAFKLVLTFANPRKPERF